MRQYTSSKRLILNAALELFKKSGYDGASMRQIAEKANVSLGLVVYHFKNKSALAQAVLEGVSHKTTQIVKRHIDIKEDAFLYTAVLLILGHEALISSPLRRFYLDVLRNGIFTRTMVCSGLDNLRRINEQMQCGYTDGQLEFYGNYYPASVLGVLVTYPNYEEIVGESLIDAIFTMTMGTLCPDGKRLDIYRERAKSLTTQILLEDPEIYVPSIESE